MVLTFSLNRPTLSFVPAHKERFLLRFLKRILKVQILRLTLFGARGSVVG
jgi:hypothetical protein